MKKIKIKNNKTLKILKEPIKIRKYNKTLEKRKIERQNKPDYIAEQIVKTTQGELIEELVFDNEIKKLEKENAYHQIKTMKEFFKNKKDNEGFDILSFEKNTEGKYIEKYIEVKSTKGQESTPIDITENEIEFAKKHKNQYYIYRIILSNSENRYVKIIKGRDLFKHYELVPTAYKIYSA